MRPVQIQRQTIKVLCVALSGNSSLISTNCCIVFDIIYVYHNYNYHTVYVHIIIIIILCMYI